MKFNNKYLGDGTTLLAVLLVTLSIHGSTSLCTVEIDAVNCLRIMTCDGFGIGGQTLGNGRCGTYNHYGPQKSYKTDVIFKNVWTPFKMNEFIDWENTFRNTYTSWDFITVSVRNNNIPITPLIRTYIRLNIKHFDVSHNFLREFNLNSLHNIPNLESINLSHNYISDLQGPAAESKSVLMKSLLVLDLSYNQIERIDESIFSTCTALKSLDLSHNNISYVSFQSFIGLDNLRSFNFSFNKLKEFNMALFELGSLEYLDISFNYLTTLYKQDLMKAVHIKQLNIQNNNLKSLDPQVFSSLINLEQLNLSRNHFGDSLNESLFENNVNLESVDLSYNEMGSLVRDAFSSLNLAIFEVIGNRLAGALVSAYFNGMGRVTILDLSYQHLTGVSNNTFTGAHSLEIINLSNNKISVIENKAFASLSNLTSIDLSHNRITVINFEHNDLISLNGLKINHNLITVVDENTFKNLNTLEELDISHNKIDNLGAKCLPLGSLRHLLIENNTISKIDSDAFASLSRLTELDISHFRLSKLLNNTFRGLNSVTILNISNNRIQVLEESAFRGLVNLTTLDMSNNFLDKFIIDTVDLPNLVALKLDNNLISTIAPLSSYYSLEILDLSNNKLDLDADSFDSIPSLCVLKLSNNSLNEFIVPKLEALSVLDIASNNIHTIKYSSNETTYLRKLYLTSNKVQNINSLNLIRNVFLQELYLSENLTEDIDVLSFKGLKDLTILDLNRNLVSVLLPGLFVELQLLEVLNISHNRIKEIKFGAFNGMNNLQILDLSYNSIGNIHIDIFFPLTLISDIVLDHNKINAIEDINTFVRPLTTISLGGNPLDCRWLSSLIRLISSTSSFRIETLHENSTGENLNGITCVRQDAQMNSKINNSKIQHDIRPHISNLTQSLRHILDRNISFPSSSPDTNLAPFMVNATNLLEKILNKNYSVTIDRENDVDLYTKKHYEHVETYMGEILDQLKQSNKIVGVFNSQNVPSSNKSIDVSVEPKGSDRDSVVIKELKDEILELKKDLIASMNVRDRRFDSFVANMSRYLEREKLEPLVASKGPISKAASGKLSTHEADPDNNASHIKLTEAFVVIILIVLLSVITYKVYLSKVLSGSRRLQRQSIQNIPMD